MTPHPPDVPPTYNHLPDLMQAGRWEEATHLLVQKLDSLYRARADLSPGRAFGDVAEALARLRRTEGRLAREASCIDQIMGSDPIRWELLAAIAALDPDAYRYLTVWLLSGSALAKREGGLSEPSVAGLIAVADATEAYLRDAETRAP